MSRKIKLSELKRFDVAEYLDDEKAIAEYLSVVLEENDEALLLAALNDVARARGMTEVSKASGVTREALYTALSPGAHPRFDTIQRVVSAFGVRFTVVPA
ncbi:MAG: addiction module antidote protein [Lysobacteraceae bacterium]